MSLEMTKAEKALAFDSSMLKVLIVELFQNANIPFELADNPKFQAILKYLRPDVQIPQTRDIFNLNYKEAETFQSWLDYEQTFGNSDSLNGERIQMAEKHSGIPENSTANVPASPVSSETCEVIEYVTYVDEKTGNCAGPSTKRSRTREIKQHKVQKRTHSSQNDNVNWPCIVCHKVTNSRKTRMVTPNVAYIMIYLSYMEKQYSIEKAKETAKFKKFNCCIGHFDTLFHNALHHLDVVDPLIDVHTDNRKILEAFRTINIIKDECQSTSKFSSQTIKYFLSHLSKFFEKFQRTNYITTANHYDSGDFNKPEGRKRKETSVKDHLTAIYHV